MITRRDFLKAGAVAGGSVFLVGARGVTLRATAAIPGGTLDPTTIPKYVTPLVIPPVMPGVAVKDRSIDYYEIAVRQFVQQILPPGMPATTVLVPEGRTAPRGRAEQ